MITQAVLVHMTVYNYAICIPTDVDFNATTTGSPVSGLTYGGGQATAPGELPTVTPVSATPVMAAPPQTVAAPIAKAATPPASLSASQDNLLFAGSPSDR